MLNRELRNDALLKLPVLFEVIPFESFHNFIHPFLDEIVVVDIAVPLDAHRDLVFRRVCPEPEVELGWSHMYWDLNAQDLQSGPALSSG